jgi:hypothetical protein
MIPLSKFLAIVAVGTLLAIPAACWSLYLLWWWVG